MEFLPFNILGAAPYISDLCLGINRQLTYKKDLTISYLIWIYQMFELKERQKYRKYIYCFMKISYCCCSVAKWCLTLCDPMKCGIPGFPVLHYLPGFAQTHIHWVIDAIQPSHSVALFSFCLQSFQTSGSFPFDLLAVQGLSWAFSNTTVWKHQLSDP